jgi:hypothetical protein
MSAEERRIEKFVEVLSVDAEGRPALVRKFDSETGMGVVEFVRGYRPEGRVEHVYNPLDALKERSE